MRLLFFSIMLYVVSAEERPAWHETLLNRIENLEKKDAEKDTLVAKQQKEIERLQTCSCESKSYQREFTNGPFERRRFVLNEGPVAFTAALTNVVDHLKHNEIVKFETVITNIGGGYNNQTGVFVVPISGIYMFSCSLLDDHDTGTMVHGEMVQDNRVLGRIFAHAEVRSDVHYRDQGAQTVFTHAHVGEQIRIRVKDNNDLGVGGELYSTFSGYLLYAMD